MNKKLITIDFVGVTTSNPTNQKQEQIKRILKHETTRVKLFGVAIREIKILDQYGDEYIPLIQKYQAPKSICGYVVSAVAPLLSEWTSFLTTPKDLDNLINLFNDPTIMIPKVEEAMSIIQSQRQQYISNFTHEFKRNKEKDAYMTDWVANYEISDVLQILSTQQSNVYFLRQNAYQFPDLVKKVKHEEKKRVQEEIPFKNHKFMVESFSRKRNLQTVHEFILQNNAKELARFNKPMIIVCDLKGHYVTFLACRVVDSNGNIENNLLLLNSTETNYTHKQEVLHTLCQIAFPN